MDGLSGAASIGGIISLAIQLIDSTQKIYKFLEEVKHAPDEVVRLRRQTTTLYNLLKGVQDLVEMQNAQQGMPSSTINLHDALKNCEADLNFLNSCTTKIVQSINFKGMRRISSAFKIHSTNELIKKAETRIHHAIEMLNAAVGVNHFMVTLSDRSHKGIVVTRTEGTQTLAQFKQTTAGAHFVEGNGRSHPSMQTSVGPVVVPDGRAVPMGRKRTVALLDQTIAEARPIQRSDSSTLPMQAHSQTLGISGRRIIRVHQQEYSTFFGIYRSRTVWTKSRLSGKDGEDVVNYCTTMYFQPSLINIFLVWQMGKSSGRVPKSPRTYPMNDLLLRRLVSEFTHLQHDPELQGATLRRQIDKGFDPFTLDKYGDSLLDFALRYGYGQVVEILTDLGVVVDPLNQSCSIEQIAHNETTDIARTIASTKRKSHVVTKSFEHVTISIFLDASDQVFWSRRAIHHRMPHSPAPIMANLYHSSDNEDDVIEKMAELLLCDDVLLEHERVESLFFIFDTVIGMPWLETEHYAKIGLFLVQSVYAECDFQPLLQSWISAVGERTSSIAPVVTRLQDLLDKANGETKTIASLASRPYALGLVDNELSLDLIFDEGEPALELCLEFQSLLLHDVYPYVRTTLCDEYLSVFSEWGSRNSNKMPRKWRKAHKRKMARERRQKLLTACLPGSYSQEDEDDEHFCNIHCILKKPWGFSDWPLECHTCVLGECRKPSDEVIAERARIKKENRFLVRKTSCVMTNISSETYDDKDEAINKITLVDGDTFDFD